MTPSGPFSVHYSGKVSDRARALILRGLAMGIGQRVSAALQYIEGRLILHPTEWGEYIYRLPTLRLKVYERIHDGLYVAYSVREDEHRVWITRLHPVPGHPLHDPNEPPGGA